MGTSDITSIEPRAQARRWIEVLTSALQGYNFNYTNEADLQKGVQKVFETLDAPFEREFNLSEKDRIDFYWPESKVGVEVKIDHSLSDLTRQVHRYVQHDNVQGILVISGKVRLNALPVTINHKPVHCYSLIGSLL